MTLDERVEWMRQRGVVHMVDGAVTLTLGPAPLPLAPAATTRAEDFKAETDERVRMLFQSSPVDPEPFLKMFREVDDG